MLTDHRFRGFSLSLRGKIISPYLILALGVAIVTTYVLTSVVLVGLHERFENQLRLAAAEATDALVRYERQQINWWRQVAFTTGVAEAARHDNARGELQRLVEPLFALHQISRLDIITPDGAPLLYLSQNERASRPGSYAAWPIVQAVLSDPRYRYAGLQEIDGNLYFFTAGALTVPDNNEATAILLVGASLSELAVWLRDTALAGITLYGLDGQLWATTIGQAEPTAVYLEPATIEQMLGRQGTAAAVRTLQLTSGEQAQLLLPLVLRGETVGAMGISLPADFLASPLYPARMALIGLFTIAVIATLLIGYKLAATISRPIEALQWAARQVEQGNLTTQVAFQSNDEIGQLSHSFNNMVMGLRQRRLVEDLFGCYVGDEIAQRILAGEVNLGGHRLEATALFADIRDFTTLSERADVNCLIEELNEYYGLMQAAVHRHGGVINKFGGDSILALFGAPLSCPDHARQAVSAAVDVVRELELLNERRLARGDAPLRVGIGINSGEMVVGNLGAEQRREYTAIGDSVNTAKRLSDLNKEMPEYTVFLSEGTLACLDDAAEWPVDRLGNVQIKGKQRPMPVYALNQPIFLEVEPLTR